MPPNPHNIMDKEALAIFLYLFINKALLYFLDGRFIVPYFLLFYVQGARYYPR